MLIYAYVEGQDMTLPFKILIVDDSSIDRMLLSKMVLKGRCCEIFEAQDGASAINAPKNSKFRSRAS